MTNSDKLYMMHLMAHRFLYYCCATTLLSDQEYDRREKIFEARCPGVLGVGSDKPETYSTAVIGMACLFVGPVIEEDWI